MRTYACGADGRGEGRAHGRHLGEREQAAKHPSYKVTAKLDN